MSLIWMAIVGFFAGLVARFLMPGEQRLGCLWTTGLGIAGAYLAGFLGQALGWYRAGQGAGFIGSVVGSVIVLGIYGMVKRA